MDRKSKKLPPKLKNVLDFATWKKQMILHWKRSGVFQIVEGTEREPEAQDDRKKFHEREAGAHFDLLACLEGKLKQFALAYDTLPEAWTAIKEACTLADDVELQKVEDELEKFQFDGAVLSTITSLLALLHRLSAVGGEISDNQKTLKLLKILPKSYTELVLQIKTDSVFRKPDSSFDFTQVVKKVQQRAMACGDYTKKLMTEVKSEKVFQAKKVLKCYNCGEEGHVKFKCKKCFRCKQPGHKSFDCPMRERGIVKKSESLKVFVACTAKQTSHQELVKFCLDSAATTHCCSKRSIMTNLRKVSEPFVVETLDSSVVVDEIGDIEGEMK